VNVDPDRLGPAGFGDRVFVTKTHVGGFDFIPAQPERSVDAEPGLAWDGTGGPHNGRVYLVYTAENPNEGNNTDIYLRHSDDNGVTRSAAVRVNNDTTASSQFLPKISLDPTTGNIAAFCYDSRNDLGTGGPGDTTPGCRSMAGSPIWRGQTTPTAPATTRRRPAPTGHLHRGSARTLGADVQHRPRPQ
jgi:hypothetical protein